MPCPLLVCVIFFFLFFFNDTATTEIYTLSLHDALPIWAGRAEHKGRVLIQTWMPDQPRSEEHTSELQSRVDLVCRLLLEKKKADVRRSLGYAQERLGLDAAAATNLDLYIGDRHVASGRE